MFVAAATPPPCMATQATLTTHVADVRASLRQDKTCQVTSTYSNSTAWTFDSYTRGRIVDGVLYIELRNGQPAMQPADTFDRVVLDPNVCVVGFPNGLHVYQNIAPLCTAMRSRAAATQRRQQQKARQPSK